MYLEERSKRDIVMGNFSFLKNDLYLVQSRVNNCLHCTRRTLHSQITRFIVKIYNVFRVL